jgi:hypothetical protein
MFLCKVSPDDGLQKMPKHVAAVVYIINLLLSLMGENKNIYWKKHMTQCACFIMCFRYVKGPLCMKLMRKGVYKLQSEHPVEQSGCVHASKMKAFRYS